MRKIGIWTVLALSAFCLLTVASPQNGYATSTASLIFNTTAGATAGGETIFPYYFTVNGVSNTPLMCLSDFTYINYGESWTADVYTPQTAPSSGPGMPVAPGAAPTEADFVAAAWLVNDAKYHLGDAAADQWAAWDLFNPGPIGPGFGSPAVAGATSQQSLAMTYALTHLNTGFTTYAVYIWDGNPATIHGQYGNDDPQIFVEYAPPPTPEPSSLLLLGTGLFGLALLLFRRAGNRTSHLVLKA